MAIVKKDYLFEIIRRTKKIFWEVKDGNVLIDNYEELNGDEEKSIMQLDECLTNIESGYATVMLSARTKADKHEKPGNLRGVNSMYRVKCGEEVLQRIPEASNNSNSEIDRLKREIIELKHQHELENIKREFNERIEDLECDDEEEDGIGSVLTKQLTPHIPAIIMSLTGINIAQSPSLNGNEDSPEEINVINIADQKTKCVNAINLLLKIDKNAGDHLMQLSILAQNKPEVYQMALGYLKTL